jgi:hypothetical protein
MSSLGKRSRRGLQEQKEIHIDDEDDQSGKAAFQFSAMPNYDTERCKFSEQPNDIAKWNKLTVDAQNQCIKAVARLFIFKGVIR